MAALDNTQATATLKGMLGLAAWLTVPTANKIKLGSTAPTSSANMTEITGGSGYTTGGSTTAYNAVSGTPPSTTLSASITWTNSGATWSIVGAELWDTAATPLRWFFGSWNGQPISVVSGNAFQVARGSGGLTVSLS